jgi:3-isopropylmalate/(R)-2-methylmalate dehydratase large subunit
MRVVVDGKLPPEVSAKDIILSIIGEVGAAGGIGYAMEFSGEAICALSMEGRMTVCNMSVEAGARTGIMAPDEKTWEYLKDRPKSPKGRLWDEAMRCWETLHSDEGAEFDREVRLDVSTLPPLVTWGTNPEQVISITGRIPRPGEIAHEGRRAAAERSLAYMGLQGGERIVDIALDRVFIGSCANARIEDLREVARVADGRTVNANVRAMIGRRPARDIPQIRLRLAGARLFDVSSDEPRQARARRALRLDLEPQFRGPSRLQRPHPSGLAGHGSRRGDRRQVRRCA